MRMRSKAVALIPSGGCKDVVAGWCETKRWAEIGLRKRRPRDGSRLGQKMG